MYTILIKDHDTAILQAITDNSSQVLHWYANCQPQDFTLQPGWEFPIEAQACETPIATGSTYHVTGSWLNYDQGKPSFTLAITSAQLITF